MSIRAAIALVVACGCGMLCAARAGTAGLVHEKSIYTDGARKPLESPEGVGCAEDGRLVVADTAHGRLLLFTWNDGRLEGGSEIKLPEVPRPTMIQLDPAGNMLVLDRKTARIAVLDARGAFVRFLEIPGVTPKAFKLVAGKLYVLDAKRVLVLDSARRIGREVALPSEGEFMDVAAAPAGAVYVIDSVSGTLFAEEDGADSFRKLTPGPARQMSFPTYVAIDETGRFFVVDRNEQAIVLLDKDGGLLSRALRYGRADGLLNYPGQLCLTHRYAFVADRNNNRVQIFSILR
ncbi:MAG: NHL repeat-containing protein [Myxococcales bacterium]